jgi:redox-sensing transcriptional repressor
MKQPPGNPIGPAADEIADPLHQPGRSVPMATLERLSVYFNCLIQAEHEGLELLSSAGFEERTGISAYQVRKDLSHFGEFGLRGRGYSVPRLRHTVARILCLHEEQPVVLAGAGNLGAALLSFPGWRPYNLRIAAVFDVDPAKVGRTSRSLTVQHIDDLPETVARLEARMGIIAVPAEGAQRVAASMVGAGIRVILNFAPIAVFPQTGVSVRNVCFLSELAILSYLARCDREDEGQRNGGIL